MVIYTEKTVFSTYSYFKDIFNSIDPRTYNLNYVMNKRKTH